MNQAARSRRDKGGRDREISRSLHSQKLLESYAETAIDHSGRVVKKDRGGRGGEKKGIIPFSSRRRETRYLNSSKVVKGSRYERRNGARTKGRGWSGWLVPGSWSRRGEAGRTLTTTNGRAEAHEEGYEIKPGRDKGNQELVPFSRLHEEGTTRGRFAPRIQCCVHLYNDTLGRVLLRDGDKKSW